MEEILDLKERFPASKLVVGSTEVGIEMKFKDCKYPVIVAPTHVPELNAIKVTATGLEVGASVTLTRLLHACKDLIASRPAYETATLQAIVNQLRWFAGMQIRNVSSLGGNICTGSPISDLNPIWMASRTTFTVVGKGTGERDVPASEFFLGYRQVDLKPHELLSRITIPFTRQYEYVKEFKQSPRREDDIAIVNAGMRVLLGQDAAGTWRVEEASMAFGGVAAKAIMAPQLAAALVGQPWEQATCEERASMAFGGVAAKAIMAPQLAAALLAAALVGQPWEQATCEAALDAVSQDVLIDHNAGGRVKYWPTLTSSFVFNIFAALEAVSQNVLIGDNAPGGRVEYRHSLTSSFAALEAVSRNVLIGDNAPGGCVKFCRSLTSSLVFQFFAALEAVSQDVLIGDNAPGGRVEYRRSLTSSFVFKFFVHAACALEADSQNKFQSNIPAEERSAAQAYERPPACGVQYSATAAPMDVVGHPHQHMAADLQVSGEATYVDDVKLSADALYAAVVSGEATYVDDVKLSADALYAAVVSGEATYVDDVKLSADALYAAVVTSSKPHAKITKLDASKALEIDGVAGFYCAKDIPAKGTNKIGPVALDEEVYVESVATAVGAILGVIVAETEAIARRAAKLAIEADQFYPYSNSLACGDVDAAFGKCDHVVEGVFKLGGQEHFYLETNACLVVPHENHEFELISSSQFNGNWSTGYCLLDNCLVVPHEIHEIELISSSQAPMKHQKTVAYVLGVPAHKIVSKVKRLGGGFGGKETRGIFLHAAIAVPAYHLRRPVKIMLDRDEDMQMTGHRHAFMSKYKVGFSKEGKVEAVDIQLFSNGGNSLDLSASIMDRALMHSDCCYNVPKMLMTGKICRPHHSSNTAIRGFGGPQVPNMRVTGKICRTNQSSNTAFRGFGGPQGMMFAEMWMDVVARTAGKPVHSIRELNMQGEGDVTHYSMVLEDCRIGDCWNTVKNNAAFDERLAAVKEYNVNNRWRKRGIAILPTKFGISFTTKFLNQAGALVHVYLDGTALVTHGGVEMGQGLHTKMAQVAAQQFGIMLSDVYIAETSTDKVPNASPTAASASSDMYGGAVLDACKQIMDRLAPFREKMGVDKSFKEVVNAAYLERTDLSAHGFYATPDITGDVERTDLSAHGFYARPDITGLRAQPGPSPTDESLATSSRHKSGLGNPINPAIDIGQVEGGFVQGMGWLCLEELQWGDKQHPWVRPGHLFTKGPGTYKIPSANDIPIDFRVTLLADAPNTRAIHSSKAVGEPPFHLGASVFFALKDAVYSARESAGHGNAHFILDAPATPERLRMLCADKLTAKFAKPDIRPKISC
eukprot:gene22196-29256_t